MTSQADHSPQNFDIFKPGENCWRIEPAQRVGILIDTADYFEAFKAVCGKARRSLFILGWDFDRLEDFADLEAALVWLAFLTAFFL